MGREDNCTAPRIFVDYPEDGIMTKINKAITEKLAGLSAEKRLLLFQKLEEQSRKMHPPGAYTL